MTRTYQSGDWYGVVGPRVVLLLPPQERQRVAALWAAVDDGADLDETLDLLLAGGLRGLSGFVLVGADAPDAGSTRTRAVLRGPARAVFETVHGRIEVDGIAATTWVERSVTDVLSTVLEVGEVADGAASYGLEHGLVRLVRLTEGAPAGADPLLTPDGDGPLAISEETEALVDPMADPAAGPADAGSETGDGSFAWGASAAETPGTPDTGPWASTPVVPVVPLSFSSVPQAGLAVVGGPLVGDVHDVPDVEAVDDEATGVFHLGPESEPDLVPEPDPTPAAGWSLDHDGDTSLSPFPATDYELARPGIRGQTPAPRVTARPVARLLVSSGETIDVDRVVVVGRAPQARRSELGEDALLLTVPSPHQEISSVHLEVRPGSGADHGTAVVTDLGSTNGTVVVQPGLQPDELQPGVSVQLIPGAVIDLGDGVTISVSRP